MVAQGARLPDPVTQGARTPQGAAQVGQRLAVPAQDHREDVAPTHEARGPGPAGPTAPSTARSSSRSPVRVCPSIARAAAERGPDVGEAVRVAAAPGQLPRRRSSRTASGVRPWSRSTTPRAWRATDSIHGSADPWPAVAARAAAWPARRWPAGAAPRPPRPPGCWASAAPSPTTAVTTSVKRQPRVVAKASQAMTLTPGDDLNETSRQRTRDQFELLREAHGTRSSSTPTTPPTSTSSAAASTCWSTLRRTSTGPRRRLHRPGQRPGRRARPTSGPSRTPAARRGTGCQAAASFRRVEPPSRTTRTCSPPWPRWTGTRRWRISRGPTTSCTSAPQGIELPGDRAGRDRSRAAVAAGAHRSPIAGARASRWWSSTPAGTTPRRSPAPRQRTSLAWLGDVTGIPSRTTSDAQTGRPPPVRRPRHLRRRGDPGDGARVHRARAELPGGPERAGRRRARVGAGRPARRTRSTAREQPHLINLSAGCPTRLNMPAAGLPELAGGPGRRSDPERTWSSWPRRATTPARGGSGPRRSTGRWASARSTATAGCRASPTGVTRSTSSRWVATSSTPSPTAPTSATRARTSATPGSSTTGWRGGAGRRSRRRSSPA